MPLEYLKEINSTNDFIKENLTEYNCNFSGVYTFNQTKGKGVRGNQWISESEKNIALSFCLEDAFVDNSVNLSFWVAIVMRNFIYELSKKIPTYIKWPNDIIIKNKKLCGILIEKHKGITIIGIGLNVFQKNFGNLNTAASFYSLGIYQPYSLHELSENLILKFQENYNLLNNTEWLLTNYNEYLFHKDIVSNFLIKETTKQGIIKGVNKDGLLIVDFENKIEKFRLKELKLIF